VKNFLLESGKYKNIQKCNFFSSIFKNIHEAIVAVSTGEDWGWQGLIFTLLNLWYKYLHAQGVFFNDQS